MVTGRGGGQAEEAMDTVSEVKEIKHAYRAGIRHDKAWTTEYGGAPAIRPAAFIRYKFLNSLFLGLSVGAVFVLYTPLSPAVFSAGG